MATLAELEARLQSLLEVHLLKYLPGYKAESGVIQQLAAAMHSHLRVQDGMTQAPNVFVIIAHPGTLKDWHAEPHLQEELEKALYAAGNEAGFQFPSKPTVTTAADTKMPAGQLRILASFSREEEVEETHGMDTETKAEAPTEIVPSNAFLIIGGTQIVPLNRSVINLGRRLDNHVVVDDPRVSRAHAQLRVVRGRFMLFDLNSSGGTFVNNQRINQSVLYPGDVISLAGVTLIFGQDLPGGRSSSEEQTGGQPSISADRPTAILRKDDEK